MPEDLPAARKNIENSLKSGEFAGEWRIQRRNDGEIRWITARAKILRDDQGKPCRMIGVNTDITDRKRAEQALLESETKFRALSNFVPQLVWMCTPDGLNVYFNHRWVEYTGMTLEQSYGKGWNTPFIPTTSRRHGTPGIAPWLPERITALRADCVPPTAHIAGS